jgi:hypothetical protein
MAQTDLLQIMKSLGFSLRECRHTLLYAAFTFFLLPGAHAQHYNSWARLTTQVPLTARWQTDAELQYRRQSIGAHVNPIEQPLMASFRNWTYYRYNDRLRLGISPVAVFRSCNTLVHAGDDLGTGKNEYRASVMAEGDIVHAGHFTLSARYAAESRWFEGGTHAWRQRLRPVLRYSPQGKTSWSAYYEVFLTTANGGFSSVDQHRAFAGVMLPAGHSMKIETGYMYVHRYIGSNTPLNEHDVVVNISLAARKAKGN